MEIEPRLLSKKEIAKLNAAGLSAYIQWLEKQTKDQEHHTAAKKQILLKANIKKRKKTDDFLTQLKLNALRQDINE